MSRILDCLPAEQIESAVPQEEKPATVLELVRKKHRSDA
jgi:hypothetical protein